MMKRAELGVSTHVYIFVIYIHSQRTLTEKTIDNMNNVYLFVDLEGELLQEIFQNISWVQ